MTLACWRVCRAVQRVSFDAAPVGVALGRSGGKKKEEKGGEKEREEGEGAGEEGGEGRRKRKNNRFLGGWSEALTRRRDTSQRRLVSSSYPGTGEGGEGGAGKELGGSA